MVTTGFSRIHVALYANTNGTVTYSGVKELARAVSMETDVETTEENAFYANNALAEIEPARFAKGTATITVDGLDGEEEAMILGITPKPTSIGEDSVEEIAYGEEMNPPYMGIGAVKRYQLNGAVTYRPVIFTKVRFAIPTDAAETQGEEINWQTQELEATLMRDDTAAKNWKIIPKTNFDTEEKAVAYILAKLGGGAK